MDLIISNDIVVECSSYSSTASQTTGSFHSSNNKYSPSSYSSSTSTSTTNNPWKGTTTDKYQNSGNPWKTSTTDYNYNLPTTRNPWEGSYTSSSSSPTSSTTGGGSSYNITTSTSQPDSSNTTYQPFSEPPTTKTGSTTVYTTYLPFTTSTFFPTTGPPDSVDRCNISGIVADYCDENNIYYYSREITINGSLSIDWKSANFRQVEFGELTVISIDYDMKANQYGRLGCSNGQFHARVKVLLTFRNVILNGNETTYTFDKIFDFAPQVHLYSSQLIVNAFSPKNETIGCLASILEYKKVSMICAKGPLTRSAYFLIIVKDPIVPSVPTIRNMVSLLLDKLGAPARGTFSYNTYLNSNYQLNITILKDLSTRPDPIQIVQSLTVQKIKDSKMFPDGTQFELIIPPEYTTTPISSKAFKLVDSNRNSIFSILLFEAINKVSGNIVLNNKEDISHSGVTLTVEGTVQLQLSAKSVGMFEAFYNSLKPITLMHYTINVATGGKFTSGITELPFEFPLEPIPNQQLYDTYHGVFVNIQYTIRCDIKRGILSKDLQKSIEFVVEVPTPSNISKEINPVNFVITPESLGNLKKISKEIPKFHISGSLKSAVCNINDAFQGHINVESSDSIIKSIELQLVRVETCGCADGFAKEVTEIQNIQIAEGDICRGFNIPLWMVFPRLFTCISTAGRTFKIEFEINLVVMLEDGHLITENFPIKLVR
eukprot:gene2257-2780_t